MTYAGAYMDRPNVRLNDYADYTDAYDRLYELSRRRSLLVLLRLERNLPRPRPTIRTSQPAAVHHRHQPFRKLSQELRVASPAEKPFRVIAGAFYQRQSNFIHQDYQVDNLAPEVSVNGFPGTLWLTQQKRVDRDYAVFGEASWDVCRR